MRIIEVQNKVGPVVIEVMFGDQRLMELLIRHSERPLDEIIRIVTAAVRDWAYDLANQDDTTMLLARRL